MSAPHQTPAYAVGQFRDANDEIARLAQQATLLAAAEDDALIALGLPERGRVLDLGCGPGFVAARILKGRPELQVFGVDRDPAVLNRARAHIQPLRAEAGRLPFPAGAFDCVYARLVFRHLPDPGQVLREVHRVLRPGGRAIVLDSDDGALIMYPPVPDFDRALRARQQTFQRRGADPFLARRLPALLREARFGELALRTLVVDSVSVGRPAFARIVLSPIAEAIDADLLGEPEVDEARTAMEKWVGAQESFGMTTVVIAGGRKGD